MERHLLEAELGRNQSRAPAELFCQGYFPPGGKSPGGITPPEGKRAPAPSSASRRRRFVPKVLSLFFLGQNDLYTRRGAPEVGRGGHNPPGRAQVGCAHLVAPLWYLSAPIFLK